MHLQNTILLLSSIAPLFATALPQELEVIPEVVNDQYVVVLNNNANLTTHLSWLDTRSTRTTGRSGSQQRRWRSWLGRRDGNSTEYGVKQRYNIADTFIGYAGSFDQDDIQRIRNSDDVQLVESDLYWTTQRMVSQSNAPWGLGRISNRARGSPTYYYDDSAGANTYGYIVDTGVNTDHVDFEGRATKGYNAAGGDFVDTAGHGTHVAGTMGSRTYGVAKRANLIDVKVFSADESTSLSVVLDGYQWAVNDIIANGRQSRSVINLSMGGGLSSAFNQAIRTAYQNGVTSVVAAGNENADAVNTSPASAPEAITVGASDENDVRASFSNYGSLLDFFAPGVNVLSTFIGSNTATKELSGTSMASPHIAGLTLYLQGAESGYTPAALMGRLQELATRNVVSDTNGSPNQLVYNGSGR